MFFDFNQPSILGDIVTYPDFPFATVPVQPSAIGETVIITGSPSGSTVSIGGTADSIDQ